MNPYEVLGVKKDADAATIKRAFRRKARQTHPDAGGSAAAFGAVTRAYAVLSDPARRRRYDEEGVCEEPRPDNRAAEVAGVLAGAFQATVGAVMRGGGNVAEVDVINRMKGHLRDAEKPLKENERDLGKAAAALEEVLARLTEKGGTVLAEVARNELAGVRQGLEQARHQREVLGEALAYLDGCQYRREEPENPYGVLARASNTKYEGMNLWSVP